MLCNCTIHTVPGAQSAIRFVPGRDDFGAVASQFDWVAVSERKTVSYALHIAAMAYLTMALLVLIAEFCPWRKPAVTAAFASIFFASVGSTAWCYAAFYSPSNWPEFEQPEKTANQGGPQTLVADKGQEGEEDEGDEGAEATGKRGGGKDTGSAIEFIERASYGLARKTARAIGLAEPPGSSFEDDGGATKDCEDCPDLVTIPAGSALIGASDSDGLGGPAERPAAVHRFWPGFRIGREAVTAQSFERFLDETDRPRRICPTLDADVKGLIPSPYARCVSAEEADAYVTWLTGKTGRRYRLATAAEWEFAAKTAVTPVAALGDVAAAHTLRLGDVREITAECWQPFLPTRGNEIFAASAGLFLCETRMLKGWTERDSANWQRVSARRELQKNEISPDTGLRVVRNLD